MKKNIKALIVDDEELARSDLHALLSKIPSIEIVGEASDVKTAIEAIEMLNPDVVFLDIQFPRETGFDLLEKADIKAKIIFVTAFDKYAIRAFEVNALDYLIKPVDPERLALTIERLENSDLQEKKQTDFNYNDTIFIEHCNKFYFVKVNSIIMISAATAYTEIITSNGLKLLAHKSMKEWETRLPQNSFIRIHRSTIINIDFIEKMDKWFNYSYRVYLKNIGNPISISRRYIAAIRERMT
ncbi:MAG TPA: DNA-binding response regulator [Bacteroidales bacterium]|nr:DNA-binding response regulator [Bacteroidales bacterium]